MGKTKTGVITTVEGQIVTHTFTNHSSRFVHLLGSECGYCQKKRRASS